mgnify:FL=1
MFNGLIEARGTVSELTPIPDGFRVMVTTPLAADLALGESIAVNGVCLTVVETDSERFAAEISPETLRVTTLGIVQVGHSVNLERSMRADARIGGHFVQGHVDAVGQVNAIDHESDFHRVTVTFPPELAPYLVNKGSVAVDGISLTVAALEKGKFVVQIVPFTWEHTNLSNKTVGETVNLECDIIGKYVVRAMAIGEFVSPLRTEEQDD